LKSAHASLKESHAQFQVKLTKEIATCSPFELIDNANTTNPCLQARAQNEVEWIEKVKKLSNNHFAVEQWQPDFEKVLLTI